MRKRQFDTAELYYVAVRGREKTLQLSVVAHASDWDHPE